MVPSYSPSNDPSGEPTGAPSTSQQPSNAPSTVLNVFSGRSSRSDTVTSAASMAASLNTIATWAWLGVAVAGFLHLYV